MAGWRDEVTLPVPLVLHAPLGDHAMDSELVTDGETETVEGYV